MAGFKNGRVTSDILRELASLLPKLKDPRISSLISIVKVDVSGDLSYAKVYVSTIDGEEALKESIKGLKSASGFLRRELGSRLKLRKTPELKFIADDSIMRSAHIASIIESFEYNEENTEND